MMVQWLDLCARGDWSLTYRLFRYRQGETILTCRNETGRKASTLNFSFLRNGGISIRKSDLLPLDRISRKWVVYAAGDDLETRPLQWIVRYERHIAKLCTPLGNADHEDSYSVRLLSHCGFSCCICILWWCHAWCRRRRNGETHNFLLVRQLRIPDFKGFSSHLLSPIFISGLAGHNVDIPLHFHEQKSTPHLVQIAHPEWAVLNIIACHYPLETDGFYPGESRIGSSTAHNFFPLSVLFRIESDMNMKEERDHLNLRPLISEKLRLTESHLISSHLMISSRPDDWVRHVRFVAWFDDELRKWEKSYE
jgi:hypothetical protein